MQTFAHSQHAAGPWSLRLASGRSADIYDSIEAHDLQRRMASDRQSLIARAPAVAQTPLLLDSLSGASVLLPLRKKAAFAGQDVLGVRTLRDLHW